MCNMKYRDINYLNMNGAKELRCCIYTFAIHLPGYGSVSSKREKKKNETLYSSSHINGNESVTPYVNPQIIKCEVFILHYNFVQGIAPTQIPFPGCSDSTCSGSEFSEIFKSRLNQSNNVIILENE